MAERKKREEDVEVDIMGNGLDETPDATELEMNARREVKDEDVDWAENEPDDDKDWTMKLVLDPGDDDFL
jgi:hypothetical protein